MKPLLKWVGGKRWLLPLLKEIWQPYRGKTLVEPFTGGMAVALGLNPASAKLNDANTHLINFYRCVSQGVKCNYSFKNESSFYYKIRDKFNLLIRDKKSNTEEAALLFYFLIKTGYNGLCRFNNQGGFNVPFGRHKTIHYHTDFLDYRPILSQWSYSDHDFSKINLEGDEFLYADPPYDVEFTKYHAVNFGWTDQVRLAEWLNLHRGPVIASNQATERIVKLYRELDFDVIALKAPRKISCTGDRRSVLEILALRGFSNTEIKWIKKTAKEKNMHYAVLTNVKKTPAKSVAPKY